MSQESDISWQVLRQIVQGWAGTTAEPAEVKPLDGGCVSTTLLVKLTSGAKAVLKITAHRVDRSYEREAHQLELLAGAGVPVPKVYRYNTGSLDDPFSYLLMEYIDGMDWAAARQRASESEFALLQEELADILRRLHSKKETHFGRAAPGEEERFVHWPSFYRAVFDPIWQDMQKKPVLPLKSRKIINRVRDRLDRLIAHDDGASLVHWDLWGSNILVQPNGDGHWHVKALLDPNCKFAHAEAELAYLELFNTVGQPFMKAYQGAKKLGEDYHRVRKPIYQMHSLLNHVHLFGDPYARPLQTTLDKVAQLV